MYLTRYNPAYKTDGFGGLLNSLFDDLGGVQEEVRPKANIIEFADRFDVQLFIPGVDKKEVEIELDNHTLSIRGERKGIEPEGTYRLKESIHGKFSRSFTLPEDVIAEKIKAHHDQGVLTISIPKDLKKLEKKQIKIG